MSDIFQICIVLAVFAILLVVIFALMINGFDGLHRRVKKLEDARLASMRQAWDEGFSASVAQDQRQKRDPRHPITRTNPYAESK